MVSDAPGAPLPHGPVAWKGGDVPRCEATNVRGQPCMAPESVVDLETGRCPAHRQDGHEAMRELGRRGAEATKRRWREGGMDTTSLRTPEDAQAWLEAVARAVANAGLSNAAGQTVVRAVREWLRARDAGEVTERLKQLQGQVVKLKRRGLKVS